MKVRIKESLYGEEKQVGVYVTEQLNQEAQFAFALLEKWGPVVGKPDGEDSAGRSKLRSMSPEETALQAFDIASAAFKVARERGLIVQLPDLNEINAEADAAAKKKADAKRAKEMAVA